LTTGATAGGKDVLCEQWKDCDNQMGLLLNINHNYFGGAAEYDKMVSTVKQRLASGQQERRQ
jgi:hypothetical protein